MGAAVSAVLSAGWISKRNDGSGRDLSVATPHSVLQHNLHLRSIANFEQVAYFLIPKLENLILVYGEPVRFVNVRFLLDSSQEIHVHLVKKTVNATLLTFQLHFIHNKEMCLLF